MLTSASARFQPMINSIQQKDQKMSGFASKATEQLTTHYHEVGLERQAAMMADISAIRIALEASAEVNKMYTSRIQQLEEENRGMKKKTPLDKAKELFHDNEKRLEPSLLAESTLEKHKMRKKKDTCEWIFELEAYKDWFSSTESGLLWVYGIGGLGKSILMSTVIEHLLEILNQDEKGSVQFLFCSKGGDAIQTVARIKRQLLFQLYRMALSAESPDVLDESNEVVSNFLGKKDSTDATQRKPEKTTEFEEAYPRLGKILGKKIFLVIDALDECTDRKDSGLLKTLLKTLADSELPLKVLICSRPESDIVDDLAGKSSIKVEDHNGPDIENTTKAGLEAIPGLSPSERALACKAIVGKAKGLFRCIDPAIEFLKKPWQRPLEKRLEELPDGLENSYLQILRQTDPDYLELLKTCLLWSIFADIKPTVAEIMDGYSGAYAEGVEGPDENPYDAMNNNLLESQIRQAGSSTFLEVTGNEVSVRHNTVKDFFQDKHAVAVPTGYCTDDLCANCQSKRSTDQHLAISDKEGHLRMAITICKAPMSC